MMSITRIVCAIIGIALASPALAQAPLLNPVFDDHAVLQRDRPIPLWGKADPNADVTLSLAGNTATVHADGSGTWRASLSALPAGGPYELRVESKGRAQTVDDVLIGDVFLCSGQSNMVLPVKRTLDADSEIEGTHENTIRMLTVSQVPSVVSLATLPKQDEWKPASPATVGEFSATCFYFARELQKSVHVPLGLINASWGGSKIRTWMSEPALRESKLFDRTADILDLYVQDTLSGVAPFGSMWESWWRSHVPTEPGREPWNPALDVRDWPTAPALGFWDDWGVPSLVLRTGMVWYRTTVELTPEQAAHGAALAIGQVDEISAAWVNGVFVGDGSSADQTYKLPPGTLHAGSNVIAVNILNTYKKGGLIGPASAQGFVLDDGNKVPLSGAWRYNPVPQSVPEPPRAPWEPLGGLSIAYNGMIAPIEPYGLRGVVWYQGESDTGETQAYRTLLPGLMHDWRQKFAIDLPFLIVQLPNYGMPSAKPVDSGWAKMRDAQRASVAADKNAALVVTTDLGEDYDVHPPNKQEVGRRLALVARHLLYGENVVAGGPVAQSAEKIGNRIVINFADVQKGLVAYSAQAPIGFELCGATQQSCRFATAEISGGRIVLTVPAKFAPTHVRYCWADGPICTLFDGAGLPAAPFDLSINGRSKAMRAMPNRRATR
jgi:sialate O-acetylesterase